MSDVPSAAIDGVRRLLASAPGLARLLAEILDRRERRGRLPASATLAADGAAARALADLVSRRAVRDLGDGRVRVDLRLADSVCHGQLGAGLDAILYAALERAPRDPAAEDAAVRAAVISGLGEEARRCASDTARAFLEAEAADAARGTGETYLHAARAAAADAVAEAGRVARCLDAALANDRPVRVANFAARVLGDSKALAAGSDRARRVGTALLDHHEPTRDAVFIHSGALSDRQARRFALEVNGVYRDEAALTVHCFGPLVYRKAGARFDHVARHAALGEPAPLSLAQLRGAAVDDLPVERALVIENQTPFLDYVEALVARGAAGRELIVFSGGQASWAVIELLRMVGRAGVPIAHTGDLDRAGVAILRSLGDRCFAPIEPVAMDAAVHARYRDRGRPLPDVERARVAELRARDRADAPCHDLLAAIQESGVWIEQESFFDEAVLAQIPGHPGDPTGGI